MSKQREERDTETGDRRERDERRKIESPKAKEDTRPRKDEERIERQYMNTKEEAEEATDDDDEGRTAELTALFRPVRKREKTTKEKERKV